jgi:hypothetical protein
MRQLLVVAALSSISAVPLFAQDAVKVDPNS